MRRPENYLIFIVIILMTGGCAYMSHDVTIDPHYTASSAVTGQNRPVSLEVVDEREDQDIGRRTDMYGMGALITNEQDVADVFRSKISEALKAKGFEANSADTFPKLKVEVRAIKYTTSAGIMRGGFLARSAIKIIAKNGSETYEKMYRSSVEKKKFFLPFADSNRTQINDSINEVLEKFFQDESLFKFLAAEPTVEQSS